MTSNARAILLTALAGSLLAAPAAMAQRVYQPIPTSDWLPNPPTLAVNMQNDNVTLRSATFGLSGPSDELLQFNARGRPQNDNDATQDDFTIRFNPVNYEFRLRENADVVVPMLLDGRVQWGGNLIPFTNLSSMRARARVELFLEDGVGAGTYTSTGNSSEIDINLAGIIAGAIPNTLNLSRTLVARYNNLPGNNNLNYRLQATFELTAQTPVASGNGTFVDADFSFPTNAAHGFRVSVSAERPGYNANSFADVGAGAGRSLYGGPTGLDGRNVRVGVVEPGRTYNTHDALAGRVTLLNGGSGQNFTDEHTLAVSSIIAGNNADPSLQGMAPRAQIVSASSSDFATTLDAANAVIANFGAGNAGIINFSQAGGLTQVQLDTLMNANRNVTWVSAAGNFGLNQPGGFTYDGTVANPNGAYNVISVGALESNFLKTTDFSSTTGGFDATNPIKPDIVAPGEYVQSAASRDINNDGRFNDYTRSFLGDDSRFAGGATTGRIAGTSFAAPHVAGAVALLHDMANRDGAKFDALSRDHRVMKAVTLAGASTFAITDRAGNAWSQQRVGTGQFGDPVVVTRSLDNNLGAGKLNVPNMLRIYDGGEALATDNNAAQHHKIDLRNRGGQDAWDLERVAAPGAQDGTVDYFLGGSFFGPDPFRPGNPGGFVPPFYLRAVLTWDRPTTAGAYDALPQLELLFWLDGPEAGNVPGFDPMNPGADRLIALTQAVGENVKLLDLNLNTLLPLMGDFVTSPGGQPDMTGGLPPFGPANFYLQVRNYNGPATDYGLALTFIPTPSTVALLGLAGLVAARRRRG